MMVIMMFLIIRMMMMISDVDLSVDDANDINRNDIDYHNH